MSTNTCPACGAPLADDATEGFCPRCLLQAGLAESDVNTIQLSGSKNDDEAVRPEPTTVRYFGDYERQSEIARGGMGVVFEARQVSLDRTVALKMILAGQLASSADVARFRREAEAAANLDNPNIVPIYEVGDFEGQQYYSMKLVEENTSLEAIERDPQQIATVLAKVARAVHHAHRRGILHRDLKPANILLDADGEPMVTDFGLAKRVTEVGDALTQTGAIVGTPNYMAPEQAEAKKDLTTAVDVWSLGAILYELLTGRPPFQADSPVDTILRVLQDDPVAPQTLAPDIPSDLVVICLTCLAKDPERRYASAEALADDLERWLRGEAISARPTTLGERLVKWVRRRPAVAGLLGVSVLAVLLSAGLIVGFGYNQRLQRALTEAEVARGEAQHERTIAQQQRADADIQRRRAQKSERNSRGYWYAADVNLAERYWEKGNIERVRELLDRQRPGQGEEDLRSFEWHYLWRLSHTEQRRLRCPAENYAWKDVTLSSDDKTLATWHFGAKRDIPLQVCSFDVVTGERLKTLSLPKARVQRLAYPWTGHRLLVVGYTYENDPHMGRVWVWDSRAGRLLADLPGLSHQKKDGNPPLQPAAITSDGKTLAIVQDAGVLLWDIDEGRHRHRFEVRAATPRLAFSPDGEVLALTDDTGTIRLWNTATGKPLPELNGHTGEVVEMEFSSDSKFLVTVGKDESLRLWQYRNGKEKFAVPVEVVNSEQERRLLVAPGGRSVVLQNRDGVQMWNVDSGRELLRHEKKVSVHCCTFSPDGKLLAASDGPTIHLWNAETGKPNKPTNWRRMHTGSGLENGELRGHTDTITALTFRPDGRTLASGSRDDTIRLWDVGDLRELMTYKGLGSGPEVVFLTRDGRTMLCNAWKELVWFDAAAYPERANPGPHGWAVQGLDFTPDGRRLVACDYENCKVYDVFSRKVLASFPTQHWLFDMALSPDGNRLATIGHRGKVGKRSTEFARLWDLTTNKLIADLPSPSGGGRSVRFSPDGKFLAGWSSSDDWKGGRNNWHTVEIWDAVTGGELARFEYRNQPRWLPDNDTVALVGKEDLLLHSVRTGRTHPAFVGFTAGVRAVAVSPTGKTLATIDGKGNVALWETSTRRKLRTLDVTVEGDGPIAFSPSGETVLIYEVGQGMMLWDVAEAKLRAKLRWASDEYAFSPDGKTLATAGRGGVTLWQLATGQELLTLRISSGTAGITELAFSPDGHTLAASTGYRDENDGVLIWRAVEIPRDE